MNETPPFFAIAIVNLDTNKAVLAWGEDVFSSLYVATNKELVFTESELTAEITRLETEYDTQEYARNRQKDYPSTGDQMDMMYKDTKNSTTTHTDAVESVKTKWPKNNTGPVE